MKKLFSLLLAVMMLAMPVLGSAETMFSAMYAPFMELRPGDFGILTDVDFNYYKLYNDPYICEMLLKEFGLEGEHCHIINGHVPVLRADGESPIKAGGRLFVIDGGISKAYQIKTGIAGYTLIYDSHSLRLAEHRPYNGMDANITPKVSVVEKMDRRVNIADTDYGAELALRISELRSLLAAYRDGTILEK